MSLETLFAPRHVVLLGASSTAGRVGCIVARNLLGAAGRVRVSLVNPKGGMLDGVSFVPFLKDVESTVDLAIIAIPPQAVLAEIPNIAATGAKTVLCLTAGVDKPKLLEACKAHGLRLIGPNCLGVLVPGLGLNASFGNDMPPAGSVALISQSGAVLTAMAAWGKQNQVGFSHLLSLGDMADVDLADVLAYLAFAPECSSIALYIEGIHDGNRFVTTAEAVASHKPIIALKSGRFSASAAAAKSHTGAMAGVDAVYSAAFNKVGIQRADDFDHFRDCIHSMSRFSPLPDAARSKLLILTNGGGFGVLAADSVLEAGGSLAKLPAQALAALDDRLPVTWSRGNPIDIIGDADAGRYEAALNVLKKQDLRGNGVDGLVILNVPTGVADSTASAEAVAMAAQDFPVPVTASWLGGTAASEAALMLEAAGIPCFSSPEAACVAALRHPAANGNGASRIPPIDEAGVAAIAAILAGARKAGRVWLHEVEAKDVFRHAGIPTVETELAATPQEAGEMAAKWPGEKLAVKIVADGLLHKSDVGGVALNLRDAAAVVAAAETMQLKQKTLPNTTFIGFAVQPMASRPKAYEIILGLTCDATFGHVLLFGQGGTSVEAVHDSAMTLTPVTQPEARRLIEKTRLYRLLKGYRNRPAVDFSALEQAIVRLSWLAEMFAEIVELDINPLLVDECGVLAVDGRIKI
ncbi:MAG: acetate--CoA ligase family protein [Holosporales bacterium]